MNLRDEWLAECIDRHLTAIESIADSLKTANQDKADAERYRKLKALATDHGWTYHVTNRNESSNGFYQRHMFSLDGNGFDESVDKLEVPE